jgi:hypothetical protein
MLRTNCPARFSLKESIRREFHKVFLNVQQCINLTYYSYERILTRLRTMKSPKNQHRAKLVLEAVVSARSPLKLHEVQAILSVRLDDKSIDLENRRYVDHLKVLCGPIVEVAPDDTVDLVHSTAKK